MLRLRHGIGRTVENRRTLSYSSTPPTQWPHTALSSSHLALHHIRLSSGGLDLAAAQMSDDAGQGGEEQVAAVHPP